MQHGVIQADGRLYVDNSILATEAVCQTHASLRYGLGYDAPGVRVKMNVGTAIHAGMDVFFAGGSAPDVLAAFERAYTAMGIGQAIAAMDEKQQKGLQAYTLANLKVIVGEYCTRNAMLPFEVDTTTIEQGFMVLLDREFNIWYTGTPDVGKVVMRGSGSVYTVDTKSTGSYLTAEYKRGYRTASQVTGYLWGLREVTGLPYVGAFINAINIKKIPDSNRRCSDHGTPYSECGLMHAEMELFPVARTPQQIEAWRVNAIALARRYRARLERVRTAVDLPMVPMEGQFAQGGGVCRQCMAADFCALGRPAAFADSMFERAGVWDPQAVRQPKSVVGAEPAVAKSRRAVQQIEVPLPPDPYWHAPEFRSLRIGQDAYQTISETRCGCRAVRLQSFGIGGRHCWSVQWWTFKVAWHMQANVPEWCLSHEVLRPTLVQAAVRFAQAEAVLTRRKSVRT